MFYAKKITFSTKGFSDLINITNEVVEVVAASKIKNGLATVFVAGSTAAVTTIEDEPGIIADFKRLMERLAPEREEYQHNSRWGDGNGFSHLRASLVGPSLTIPVANSALSLGAWQQIVVACFDNRPREREVLVQLVGE